MNPAEPGTQEPYNSAANFGALDQVGVKSQKTPNVLDSVQLFHGQRELCILHEGQSYRLRITRRGKLILQK
ncbi:MAG TPA: hemin uptake protein HemP [Gemmatales bacterium]|nr:hemin uptake protein HemP [Gemmatales bacterium]HMP15537.1 hemin uptake protein HemP [Gemmatales bacterium]